MPLASLSQTSAVTRFAPSPTGYLHLGHVAHMLYVWGLARKEGGQVLLRIEDHDNSRCRPEYEQAILEDMHWLGLVPDGGFTGAKPDPFRQSDNAPRYEAALELLKQQHHIYACNCSRADLVRRQQNVFFGDEMPYDGYCRNLGLPLGPGHGIRLELEDAAIEFEDGILGKRQQQPARQCGDLLLKDRHGNWTYQFAVTVDDMQQGISLIVRGQDLVESTGRQIMLGQMLGRAVPAVFIHHPLVLDEGGYKLSKRVHSESIRGMRLAGIMPQGLLGRAAHAVGLAPTEAPLKADALASLF